MIILNSIDEEMMKNIHDNSFPLPRVEKTIYFAKKTVIDNGEVIAIGILKLTCEAIIITNQKKSMISRIKAIFALFDPLNEEATKFGLEDCHIFIKHKVIANIAKRLGFVKEELSSMSRFL